MSLTDAQRISILHLLHTVPERPFANPLPSTPVQAGYVLSFRQELHLAHTLAFLSNIREDTEYVPAVCIAQSEVSQHLDVLIAVNKLGHDAGLPVLEDIAKGFRVVFDALGRVCSEANENIEHDIFAAIVSLCRIRILSRLRFGHDRQQKAKQPLKDVLRQAIDSITSGKGGTSAHDSTVSTFVERARSVIRLTEAWAKHQVNARLVRVVDGIHNLAQLEGLDDLIDGIPNKLMMPSSRTNLLNIIRKVSRYRDCAVHLLRLAKRCDLVRRMKVATVDLPREVFHRRSQDEPPASLEETVASLLGIRSKVDLHDICRLLGLTVPKAILRFDQQAEKTSKKSKLHAKIQLLHYCDQRKSTLYPRVVCSSKDACYLCNTFIAAHGKVYTPRCHGRLWPGWRLPATGISNQAQQAFSTKLEGRIREGIQVLLQRRQRTIYPDPAESTMLSLSSLASANATPSSVVEACSTQSVSIETQVGEPSLASSAQSLSDADSDGNNSSTETVLIKGRKISDTLRGRAATSVYTTRRLEIQIENARVDSTGPDEPRLPFNVQWLADTEREMIDGDRTFPVVDVNSLSGERVCQLDDSSRICLSVGGEMVEFVFR